MSRRRHSPAEDIMDIAAALPWWAGVSFAAVSYLILHQFSDLSIKQHVEIGQMGSFAIFQLSKTLAYFGQYILPVLFSVGALASFLKDRRDNRKYRTAHTQSPAGINILKGFFLFSGISSWASLALCIAIFLVTSFCVYTFNGSKDYLLFLSALFLFSAIKATKTISAKNEKVHEQPPHQEGHFNTSRNYTDTPAQSYPAGKMQYIERNIIDISEIEKADKSLFLDQYLLSNNYCLKIEIIDAIEWKRFELLCHLIFRASGYNSRLTGDGADEGVDIRLYDDKEPGKLLYLVQCKKWKRSRKIDRSLIQQLRGQMAYENVEKGGYCSTAPYTSCAYEFAAANNIELFDQDKIIESFNKLDIFARESILRKILEGDYWTPSCASCGDKLKQTTLKTGKVVWGCSNSKKHGWISIPYFDAKPIDKLL